MTSQKVRGAAADFSRNDPMFCCKQTLFAMGESLSG
jgi:hypothetical protein